ALTTFGESGSLNGIAYMAGHKQLTTSSIYIRAELSSAQKMLGLVDEAPPAVPSEANSTEPERTSDAAATTGEANAHGTEVVHHGANAEAPIPARKGPLSVREIAQAVAEELRATGLLGGQAWGTHEKTHLAAGLVDEDLSMFSRLCEEEDSWPSQASPRALRAIPAPNEENPALTS